MDKKKKENIAEYVIHLYQTESLLRAYEMDVEELAKNVVDILPSTDEEKLALRKWYQGLAVAMKEEGILDQGHLKIAQDVVEELDVLYARLEKEDEAFQSVLEAAAPHITEYMNLSNGSIKSRSQVCLNGVFGLLLARMNGKQVDEEILESLNHFGNVLSYLSYHYRGID